MKLSIANTMSISQMVYTLLPDLLKDILSLVKDQRQKDIVLLGLLSAFGAVFHKARGLYNLKWYHPNINVFIAAPPASGKGILSNIHKLFYQYHKQLNKNSNGNYEFLLPANSSQAAFLETLNRNDGFGLMFETEADVLSNSIGQEWGINTTDFRRGFEHEAISKIRAKEKLRFDIENPLFGVVLSGTPNQIPKLFNNNEDGTFSRFLFYCFASKNRFQIERSKSNKSSAEIYLGFYPRIESLIKKVNKVEPIISLTDDQWDNLELFFQDYEKSIITNIGEEALDVLKRMSVSIFKILITLTIIRNENNISKDLTCDTKDLKSVLSMSKCLLEHSLLVYTSFKKQKEFDFNEYYLFRYDILDKLGEEFTTKELINEFANTEIGRSQAFEYKKKWVAEHKIKVRKRGRFQKC